jgi:hypothetical protein
MALVLLAMMAVHAFLKWRAGILPEMLWVCHIATFLLIVGLWTRTVPLVGMAFLWHLCVGDPAYLVEGLRQGDWAWNSVLVHALPPLAGLVFLRRSGLPRSSPWLAFGLFLALMPLSRALTPPGLNINLVHRRIDFLEARFPGAWSYRLVFASGTLALLLAGDALLALGLKRPSRRVPATR